MFLRSSCGVNQNEEISPVGLSEISENCQNSSHYLKPEETSTSKMSNSSSVANMCYPNAATTTQSQVICENETPCKKNINQHKRNMHKSFPYVHHHFATGGHCHQKLHATAQNLTAGFPLIPNMALSSMSRVPSRTGSKHSVRGEKKGSNYLKNSATGTKRVTPKYGISTIFGQSLGQNFEECKVPDCVINQDFEKTKPGLKKMMTDYSLPFVLNDSMKKRIMDRKQDLDDEVSKKFWDPRDMLYD